MYLKNKNYFWIGLLIFAGFLEPASGAMAFRNNRKIKYQNTNDMNKNFKYNNLNNYSEKSDRIDNNYFELQNYLNSFLKKYIASLENDNSKTVPNSINIEANMQSRIGSKTIAEGEVKVRTKSAFLVSNKITYDENLKLLSTKIER